MNQAVQLRASARAVLPSWQWWPSLVALAFAMVVILDMQQRSGRGADLAPVAAASGLVYLATAALDRRSAAWPAFLLTVLVITMWRLGAIPFDATWVLLGIAAVVAIIGFARRTETPKSGLPAQLTAMIVVGFIACGALFVNEVAGAWMVAAALFAHAGWDAFHHRADRVVPRSMAEFCLVLDFVFAVFILLILAGLA